MITEELLRELRLAIGTAHFRLDLAAFAVLLGKTLPDVWVEEKFRAFHQLAEGLAQTPDQVILAVSR